MEGDVGRDANKSLWEFGVGGYLHVGLKNPRLKFNS